MKHAYERFRRFCAFITGFVFFISGILKVLDPVGAGLVMKEYFDFLHVGFLSPAAKAAGTVFALLETLTGAALITGVWRRLTAIIAMSLQGFFTLLTLALVIFNPEMDCGCFGEAIHLTHLETFIKNLVLCVLLAGAFIPMKDMGEPLKKKYVSFGIVAASVAAFCIYSLMYIPLIDFTEFRQTARLQSADSHSAYEEDIYEAVFVYEKDGVKKAFDLQNLPDSTWTFVSTETVLKSEEQESGINLSFYNSAGEYMDRLASEGNVMVVSVYKPEMNVARWKQAAHFIRNAAESGYRPLLLVASTPELMDSVLEGLDDTSGTAIEDCLFFSDYKTLLTMNRSNGGAVWFNDGYLIRKWAERALPDSAQMKEALSNDVTETVIEKSTRGSLAFQGFLLYVFAVMLLL